MGGQELVGGSGYLPSGPLNATWPCPRTLPTSSEGLGYILQKEQRQPDAPVERAEEQTGFQSLLTKHLLSPWVSRH